VALKFRYLEHFLRHGTNDESCGSIYDEGRSEGEDHAVLVSLSPATLILGMSRPWAKGCKEHPA